MSVPANSVLPVITGTVVVGQTLTLSTGTWSGTPTYAYAWLLDGVVIAGATASTYVVLRAQIGMTLAGRVTATNIDGSATADSASQAVPGTLVPETGAGLSTADSFASLTDADAYHSKRGTTTWDALTDADKESSLRKATDFMEGRYRARWKGYKGSATQALTWPRAFVYAEPFYAGAVGAYPFLVASNIVPVEVKNACASLALRAASAALLADQSRKKKSVTVGPITTVYDDVAGQATIYAEIDAMLAIYLKASGNHVEMVRR